jgi:hypothetical protein
MSRSQIFHSTVNPEAEKQIRTLNADGYNVHNIAEKLGVAAITVRNAMRILGIAEDNRCKRNHVYRDTAVLKTLCAVFHNWDGTDTAIAMDVGVTREMVGQMRGWMIENKVRPPNTP